jgi:hypothetical protein
MRFPTSDAQPTFRLSNRVGKDDGPLSKGAAVLSITAIDDQLLDGDETKIKGAKVKFGNAWTSGDVDAFWRKGDKPGGSSISLTISPDVEGPLQYLEQADSALAIIPHRDGPKLLQVAGGAASRAGAAFEACLKG